VIYKMCKCNKIFHTTICTFLLISALNQALWYVAKSMHEIHDHGHYLALPTAKNDSIQSKVHHHGVCQICETLNQLKPKGIGCDLFITGPAFIFSSLITPLKHQGVTPDHKHFGIRAPPLV